MEICAYVQTQYAKANYKNECLDSRQFVGLRIIDDCLKRADYTVDWAGIASVHKYDIVLVSITSDCDWWSFVAERVKWQKGNYKVIVGGAGVLNVRPFLAHADYFVLGRGEDQIVPLVKAIEGDIEFDSRSVITSSKFDVNERYSIAQAIKPYEHDVPMGDKKFTEANIGCNHRCLFCGYTWHRKSNCKTFKWDSGMYDLSDKECAMLDYASGSFDVNWSKLRTTAIDGFSERMRFSVNKKITNQTLTDFLRDMIASDAKPHQVKFFNICGLPDETLDDWQELIEVFKSTEELTTSNGKQWSVVLHSTPFRPMPATPLACAPMSYRNYRGEIGKVLGKGLKGGIFYQGNTMWAVESMGTESLPTVIQSAIVWRGTEADTENVVRLARNKKFNSANTLTKQATLEKYFDVKTLFGDFKPDQLPTRYLTTYADVEKMW